MIIAVAPILNDLFQKDPESNGYRELGNQKDLQLGDRIPPRKDYCKPPRLLIHPYLTGIILPFIQSIAVFIAHRENEKSQDLNKKTLASSTF